MTLTLPQRTGRHVLYVIWQRIDPAAEVFFSTSDLDFGGVNYGNVPAPVSAPAVDSHDHASPVATPAPSPSPTPATGSGNVTVEFPQATVTFQVASDWKTGFQGAVTIKNKTSQQLKDWNLSFAMPPRIASIWNASVAGRNGTVTSINAASIAWNKDIPPSGSVTFGFTAEPGSLTQPPTGFAFSAQGTQATPTPVPTPTPAPRPMPTPQPTPMPSPTPVAGGTKTTVEFPQASVTVHKTSRRSVHFLHGRASNEWPVIPSMVSSAQDQFARAFIRRGG
jgi:hypothetical protein